MKTLIKTFEDLEGNPFKVEFKEHDISKYDVLYHVASKENRLSLEINGLLRYQPITKSITKTGMLFFSYPINHNTSDLFRWNDDYNSLIVLDAKKLKEDGYIFYDDYFGSKDLSSNRNHICCDVDIPKEYIKKVIEF